MAELTSVSKNERAGRANQLAEMFAANQVKSNMCAVQSKYKNGNAKNRTELAKWGKYYEGSARWEAIFLSIFGGAAGGSELDGRAEARQRFHEAGLLRFVA